MTLVGEDDMIRHLVEPDPGNFPIFLVIGEDFFHLGLIRLHAAMTGVARLYAGNSGGGLLIVVFVAVGAIDLAVYRMDLVVECDRLFGSACGRDGTSHWNQAKEEQYEAHEKQNFYFRHRAFIRANAILVFKGPIICNILDRLP